MSISTARRDYGRTGLDEGQVHSDALVQFQQWLSEAIEANLVDATAFTLATVNGDGQPSTRILLLKGAGDVGGNGFVFYTNYTSPKAQQLAHNPRAAMLFYWSALERQVRVEGLVEKVSADQSQAYFHSRPRDSQLSAWASHQSQVIDGRNVLEARMHQLTERYAGSGGQVPYPPFWGGYRLHAQMIEFWQGRTGRLHDRLRYTRRPAGDWRIERLAP